MFFIFRHVLNHINPNQSYNYAFHIQKSSILDFDDYTTYHHLCNSSRTVTKTPCLCWFENLLLLRSCEIVRRQLQLLPRLCDTQSNSNQNRNLLQIQMWHLTWDILQRAWLPTEQNYEFHKHKYSHKRAHHSNVMKIKIAKWRNRSALNGDMARGGRITYSLWAIYNARQYICTINGRK